MMESGEESILVGFLFISAGKICIAPGLRLWFVLQYSKLFYGCETWSVLGVFENKALRKKLWPYDIYCMQRDVWRKGDSVRTGHLVNVVNIMVGKSDKWLWWAGHVTKVEDKTYHWTFMQMSSGWLRWWWKLEKRSPRVAGDWTYNASGICTRIAQSV